MGAAAGGDAPPLEAPLKPEIKVTLEDLNLPPRRETLAGAAGLAAGSAGLDPAALQGLLSGAGSPQQAGPSTPTVRVTEEILPGQDPVGQKAFGEDGLIGTEAQQLQLLAYYAEFCEDFRRYQFATRAEGAARATDGAQLLLLSGAPGTGKTRHVVSFSRALGLPLLLANPTDQSGPSGFAARLRREVAGRDCVVFFDEIDRYSDDEAFASELRQFLDGVCQPSSGRVLLVGTTNKLKRLPRDVVHRAEVIRFEHPEAHHLAEMWHSHAAHLQEADLAQIAHKSAQAGLTGRDVRHCASWAERHTVIEHLNRESRLGYCHGAALSTCPGPVLGKYLQCVAQRQAFSE